MSLKINNINNNNTISEKNIRDRTLFVAFFGGGDRRILESSLDLEMGERENHSVKPRKKGGASYWKPLISSCSVLMMNFVPKSRI